MASLSLERRKRNIDRLMREAELLRSQIAHAKSLKHGSKEDREKYLLKSSEKEINVVRRYLMSQSSLAAKRMRDGIFDIKDIMDVSRYAISGDKYAARILSDLGYAVFDRVGDARAQREGCAWLGFSIYLEEDIETKQIYDARMQMMSEDSKNIVEGITSNLIEKHRSFMKDPFNEQR